MASESEFYAALGASSSKQGMLEALQRGHCRYFADPIDDVCGDPDYVSFLHADGAGTKAIVAYLAYRETGEVGWFRSLAQDSLVMNLDDLACVGAFEALTLSNTIGRNRFLVPDEAIGEIVGGYRDLVTKLSGLGISIQLAGGETADIGDLVRTLVVDSTLFGRARRSGVISTDAIAVGDAIVGLSNMGRATYEESANSSVGSNGFTLARHALIARKYAEKYPEICDPGLEYTNTYKGTTGLFDVSECTGAKVVDSLLSPTRTYAPVILKLHAALGVALHGLIHCSGGGQTKIMRFGKGVRYVKDNLFSCPPIFAEIQERVSVPWEEMYSVFNMGHRMEVVCPEYEVEAVILISKSFGIDAQRVGHVERAINGNELVIESQQGRFCYGC